MAIIHIQKTAPGPPTEIATATPATFPVPTREAAEIVNALNAEIPPYSSSPSPDPFGRSTTDLNMEGTIRSCTNAVRKPKKMPAPTKSHGTTNVHRPSLNVPTIFSRKLIGILKGITNTWSNLGHIGGKEINPITSRSLFRPSMSVFLRLHEITVKIALPNSRHISAPHGSLLFHG